MLQLSGISKRYQTGNLIQQALDNVSLNLRRNEFVSILGPSGSGKTTLLNIIGGLDRCDSGDLIINGVSTRKYKDRDWDAYRNHTIGFVFQSYNLIPHQSILANVELALTIGGVPKAERRARAQKALEEVGLDGQSHKRPNQLSGGQMQRVAIARALVNDPDILLADEPTGALDTDTSVQVMELLKRVAEQRLVVMVTHNVELAEQYSTRIVRLRDGRIVDDSAPFTPEEGIEQSKTRRLGRARMSFGTALSLSFNNLRTKKGRTVLTAFAGSIGIIGIALILALSSGVSGYIADIQKNTMASYPITISTQEVDISGIIGMSGGMIEAPPLRQNDTGSRIYAGYEELEETQAASLNIKENNLTAFKRYLDDPNSEIQQYLGENGIMYNYNVRFSAYSYDADGKLVASDADTEETGGTALTEKSGTIGPAAGAERMHAMMAGESSSGAENFEQLMPAPDGGPVSPILQDSYEVLYGGWPERYDEAVLILDENNSIPAGTLYQLGFLTGDEYREITEQIKGGEPVDERVWDYEEVCGHTFYLLPACDLYREIGDGCFTQISDAIEIEAMLDTAMELNIVGIVRPVEGADNASLSGPVAYTCLLTDYVIRLTDESPVVQAQEQMPSVNVLNGIAFAAADDREKAEDAREYISSLGISDKASLYTTILRFSAQDDPEEGGQTPTPGGQGHVQGTSTDEAAMAEAMERWLSETPDQEILVMVYDEYVAGSSYGDNMAAFGKVSPDAPASISIYTDSFEGKEAVSACIRRYNESASEKDQISYTDYVALLTNSVSSIIDVISYVLIAFVAVSLVVSSIMIGIITHISVMERTKEIGILRAMGASKANISQVFNAETILVGLLAGILGVGVSVLLTIPVNSIIRNLLGTVGLTASLPWTAAMLLVALSMIITVIAGLIPSRGAAKKDPVTALRTE